MSTYMFGVATFAPGAGTADANALTASTYMALQGGTSTQSNYIDELNFGGLGTATAPLIMLLGRDSTVVGISHCPFYTQLQRSYGGERWVPTAPAVGAITGGTQAQRSNSVSLGKKVFCFNAYGGLLRANYANTQDRFSILGNTASLGEASFSSFTGSTAGQNIGGHIVYETL